MDTQSTQNRQKATPQDTPPCCGLIENRLGLNLNLFILTVLTSKMTIYIFLESKYECLELHL